MREPLPRLLIMGLGLLITTTTKALPHNLPQDKALPFYKSPTSSYPSGQKSEKELSKARVRNEFQFSYLVEHLNKSFWLQSEAFLKDIDFSREVLQSETKKKFKIIESRGFWIYGENVEDQKREWLPLSQVSPSPTDSGVAINLISSRLHSEPNWKSDSPITIPPQTRLEVLSLDSTWAKVKMKSGVDIIGYVDLNNLVLKADFASFVRTSDQKWHPVLHRELDEILTKNGKRIGIQKIIEWQTLPNVGIANKNLPKYQIQLRNHLKIKRIEADTWVISQIPGHGEVFWKPRLTTASTEEIKKSLVAKTTEEILKREISSLAFHPTNSRIGIISSQGIFYTIDGETWNQIPQFGNENHPVAIGPQGEIIVGSSWSKNFGKTFEPFLKWDNFARLIETETQATPRVMKVQGLEFKGSNKLRVVVDIGTDKITLQGDPESSAISSWQLLRYE